MAYEITNAKFSLKLLLLFVVGALVFIQCTSSEEPEPGPIPVNLANIRMDMAVQIAEHSILPAFEELVQASNTLQSSSDLLSTDLTESNLAQVSNQLKSTWLKWQQAAIYQMGPTETNALRAALNTYPADTDKIEANITTGTWSLGAIGNNGAEGFPAIDYLINRTESLESLQNTPARLAYLQALVDHANEQITTTQQEWNNSSFISNFKSSQANGTDVGSALGLVINSIDLHFQRFLRDGKVGIPAGVRSAGVPRPKALEALHGGYSKELLIAALQAYVDLFQGRGVDGTSGTSLITYLDAIDQKTIGSELIGALQSSINTASSLNSNFEEQIANDNDQMVALFISLQEVVTLLKSDVSSVLGITITNQDNDGD